MSEDSNTPADDWQARAEQAEAALQRLQAEANGRLIQAELKAEAVRAGMVDLDGLKLLDLAAVKLSESGEVADAAGHVQRLKRAKPWLFNAGSSSAAAHPPRPEPPRQRHANELSHEEWVAARAVLLRRR
jgi:hypothetical protein